MSLFRETMVRCPKCDQQIRFQESDSVNGDRRPDLRAAIIDGSFQSVRCPDCEKVIRMEPQFNYLDVGNGLWIAAFPGRMLADYLTLEDTISDVFATAYGSRAQPSARAIGDGLDTRLTFGWSAIREKLVLRLGGLDDVIVELLKLDLLRRLPDAQMGPGVELRVVAVHDNDLAFAWILTEKEATLQEFTVLRHLYDAIADTPDGWARIQTQLTNGPFVDMQKLYIGNGRGGAE